MQKKLKITRKRGKSIQSQEILPGNLLTNLQLFQKTAKIEGAENPQNFEKLMICVICNEIFKEPVYSKTCMHRFCKICIEKYLRGYIIFSKLSSNNRCPTCKVIIGTKRNLRSDDAISYLVSELFPDVKSQGESDEKNKIEEEENKEIENSEEMKLLEEFFAQDPDALLDIGFVKHKIILS